VTDDPDTQFALSAEGLARRAAILRDLDRAIVQRARLRALRKSGAAGLACVALAATIWLAAPRSPTAATLPQAAGSPPSSPSWTTMIATDPDIASRLSSPRFETSIRHISDTQLQDLLAATGHATGFIRTGGRVILASEVAPAEDVGSPTDRGSL